MPAGVAMLGETHTLGAFLGYFLTATALGAGWVLGTYIMGWLVSRVPK